MLESAGKKDQETARLAPSGFKIVDGRVVFKGGGCDVEGLAAELDRHLNEWESRETHLDRKLLPIYF